MLINKPCTGALLAAFCGFKLSSSSFSVSLVSGFDIDEWLRLYLFDLDVGVFIKSKWDLSVRYDDDVDEDEAGIVVLELSVEEGFDLVARGPIFLTFCWVSIASSSIFSLQRSLMKA